MSKLSERRKERRIKQLKEEVAICREAGFTNNEDISRIMLYRQLNYTASLLSENQWIGMIILMLLAFIAFIIVELAL
jgi:hypothetical protein